MTNRLNLNFKLETKKERVEFAKTYLESLKFVPTSDELDTIAKYILWGKSSNGLNGRQEGLELETRHKTWDAQHVESLDALIESPNFSESMLRPPSDPPTRIPKETFSRSRARSIAPPLILDSLEGLWRRIDEIELLLNFYDLAHNKRKLAPRQALLDRFSTSELEEIRAHSTTITPYNYLKLKYELVEMRREQYNFKDEYSPTIIPTSLTPGVQNAPDLITFGEEIPVLPVGIPFNDSPFFSKLFNAERLPIPSDFSEAELQTLSQILWTPVQSSKRYFDFSNFQHLYKLYDMWQLLQDEIEEVSFDSNLKYFLRAAAMYRTLANLDPLLNDILDFKIQKKSNQDIVEIINTKYNKSYQANYISTLYCKKCLTAIAETAIRHREVLENLFFPENFKKCKDCGKILLMNEINFVRRHRSKDGFSPRCKSCEKMLRDSRKNK